MQREGQKRLTGLQGQKPCKKLGGKRQKIDGGALAKLEREKRLKSFEKEPFEKRQSDLLKTCFTSFDQSSLSFNRSSQAERHNASCFNSIPTLHKITTLS